MKITRAEWAWAISASILVMLFSTIPYIVGYLSETPDLRFGGAVFNRQDYNAHVATIQIGLRGDWLAVLLHTSEAMTPAFIKTFYIVLGQLGRLVHLSPPVLFEVTRWLGGLWMLLTLYAFTARFLWAVALRRAAFLFGALSSGIGWLLLILQWQPDPNISPIDFWLIDLYGFFSLLTLPHLPIVMALLWSVMLAMLNHWETRQWRWLIVCVVCVVVMQMIQPFAPVIADVVLVGYAVSAWRTRQMRFPFTSLTLLAIAQIPLALYSVLVLYGDPLWSGFSRQNVTLSPNAWYYVFGLGIPGLLAAIGVWRVARRGFGAAHLLVVWVIAVAILVYLPVSFQRRFTEGVSAPIAILAALGLGYVVLPGLARWKRIRRARGFVLLLLLGASMFSTFYLAFGGALFAATRSPKLFEPTAVVQAIDWLGANADWRDTVLSAERTGSYIPARIGQRVYLGHEMETLNHARKSKMVERFFGVGTNNDERRAVLRECNCRFVFWGPYERELGLFRPGTANFMRLVYANQDVSIYQVVDLP